jgi:hypothetical protein
MDRFHTHRQSFSNARLTPVSFSSPRTRMVKDFELTTGVVPHFAVNGAARGDRAPIVKGIGK